MRKAVIFPLIGFRPVKLSALEHQGFLPNKARFNPETKQAVLIIRQSMRGNDFPCNESALGYMCQAERDGRCAKSYALLADRNGNIFLDSDKSASYRETCITIETRLKGIEPRQGNGDPTGGKSYGPYYWLDIHFQPVNENAMSF